MLILSFLINQDTGQRKKDTIIRPKGAQCLYIIYVSSSHIGLVKLLYFCQGVLLRKTFTRSA